MPGIYFQRNRESVRRQLELATAIVTVSEYHRQYLADLCPRWHPEDIHVVHYGLDPMEFTPAHSPADDNTMHIISVGTFVEKKGHEYLIEACARLAKRDTISVFDCRERAIARMRFKAQIDEHGLQDWSRCLAPRTRPKFRIFTVTAISLRWPVSLPKAVTAMGCQMFYWKPWPCNSRSSRHR